MHPHHRLLSCVFALGLYSALVPNAMACYTVYNPANQVIYQANTAPIDMSYQIHERLPAVFPSGHMVFSLADNDCPQVNVTRAQWSDVAVPPGSTLVRREPARRSRPVRAP